MTTDWLIVGAGLTGCTLAERIASVLDKRVIVIDKRTHLGGNTYDYYNDDGILVHRYGPHVFHTHSKTLWDYLSQFTEWRAYTHRVLALVDGQFVPVPFNLTSLSALFPSQAAEKLKQDLLQDYGEGANVSILRLREASNANTRRLADYVYDRVFYRYTVKQWGLTPEQLDPSVTARVPVRVSHDDRYFQDAFQGMPRMGYTSLCERMLRHRNIELLLGVDFRQVQSHIKFSRMVYTGPMDEFFDSVHGTLPYRSLRFEFRTFASEQVQPAPTLNYPDGREYTRSVEMKQLTGQAHNKSTVVVEYPLPYIRATNEPYYPIPQREHQLLKQAYEQEASRLAPRVLFAGRLADYCYYNMDQAVARALSVFERDVATTAGGRQTFVGSHR